MHRSVARFSVSFGAVAALAATVACNDKFTGGPNIVTPVTPVTPVGEFVQTNLVADVASIGAKTVDANLVNPWGMAFGSTGILWVANNGTGTSTTYAQDGTKQALTVTIPAAAAGQTGVPTGMIFNSTTDFGLSNGSAALFLFAAEDGTISAWNANSGTAASIVSDRSATGAVYKGLAMASSNGANFLYATNFHAGTIDMFDKNFAFVKSFSDATIPAGFAPFGIANINGTLYVTFAKQLAPDNRDDQAGVGNGFVDAFNADGSFLRRVATQGTLNSPWGIAVAPTGFGSFGGDILIGNFGDGLIGAYDPNNGSFLGLLRGPNTAQITIPGLWQLLPAPGGAPTVFFSSGPNEETHGLVGTLTPNP